MTEPSHSPTLENAPEFTRHSRTLECPACFHRFQVYEYGPTRFPKSKAYRALLAFGLTSRELAEDTGLTRQRITEALSGENSFPAELWSGLAHRLGAQKANRIRHTAFLDRRRRKHQSLDRPIELPLAVLWDVGLTPPQLAWHARINPKRTSQEIVGQQPLSTGLAETLLRLAGRRVLEKLREA